MQIMSSQPVRRRCRWGVERQPQIRKHRARDNAWQQILMHAGPRQGEVEVGERVAWPTGRAFGAGEMEECDLRLTPGRRWEALLEPLDVAEVGRPSDFGKPIAIEVVGLPLVHVDWVALVLVLRLR